MNREELAIDYFYKGYNCTQAIVLAFKDLIDIDENKLLKIASPFGGGMSRLREVCGAFSGIVIVAGYLFGYDDNDTGAKKNELYSRIQELAKEFEKENGSLTCRKLLNKDVVHDNPISEKRTPDFYKNRPCPKIIGSAAKILNDYIKENDIV